MNFKGTLGRSFILADPGAVTGGGKKCKRARKKFARRKVKNVLDFSSPEFFSHPFRLFPAPCNCPWVSEDVAGYDCNVFSSKQQTKADETFQSSSYSV